MNFVPSSYEDIDPFVMIPSIAISKALLDNPADDLLISSSMDCKDLSCSCLVILRMLAGEYWPRLDLGYARCWYCPNC